MKKIAIILSAILILSLFPMTAGAVGDEGQANTATAKIVVGGTDYYVNVGETVTYTVTMQNDTVVANGQFGVSYTSSVLSVSSKEFPGAAGHNLASYDNKDKGLINFNYSDINGCDFTNGDILVKVIFNVDAEGEAAISFIKETMASVDSSYVMTEEINNAVFTEAFEGNFVPAPSTSESSASETAASETAASETAASETAASETAASETAASETAASETTASETAASETSASETAASESSASETNPTDPIAKTCTITFDADGAKGEMAAVTVEEGSEYTIPECGFTAPAGSYFGGWTKDDLEILYIPGEKFTVTKDVTFKASWIYPDTIVKVKATKTKIYVGATTLAKATVQYGKGTTTYTSSNKKVATVTSAGKVKGLKAGSVTITATNNGSKAKIKITIVKRTNPMTVKAKKLTVSAKVKKTTFKKTQAFTINKAKGTVSFKKVKGDKKVAITKKGVITVKKGLKKGKNYKVQFKVTAKGTTAYKAKSKTVTVVIIIK